MDWDVPASNAAKDNQSYSTIQWLSLAWQQASE